MKFQPSAIAATNLSGKSGGTVATITNTFRRKSNPRQPNSTAQLAVRTRFGTLSTGWGSLTEDQQNDWIAAVPNFVFFKHGETYTLKGNSLYQKLNNNLLRAGQTTITTPALPAAFPNFSISSIVTTITDSEPIAQIFISGPTDYTGYTIMALACHPVSPGKRALQNLILELGPVSFDTDHVDLAATYPSFFSDWVDGKRVELGIYLISNTSGQATTWQTQQGLITTT